MKSIVRAPTNADELTRSLANFGHKDPAKKVLVEVKSFIAALTESLSRLLLDDIALRITDAESANILVDKSELDWAFFNLAANSKDAIVGAGQIVIGSKGLTLTSNRDELTPSKYIVISVSDDGAGIKQDIKFRVFEPYFNTKKIGNGKGMGLALLQSLIQDSKGHVQLESEYGQGTTISLFFISLFSPIAEPEEKAAALPSLDDLMQVDTKVLSILLVQDNAEVLAAIADTLYQTGFKIFQCASGNAALVAIEDETSKFDLLCVDAVIPGASSAELIEALSIGTPAAQ